MLEQKVREYFECEYNITKNAMESHSPVVDRKNCVWYALQRCLGVAQFVQGWGDDFINIEPLYEEYRKKFEKLS